MRRRYLSAEKAFHKIDIFEQRASVGGIWRYHKELEAPLEDLATPQVSPHTGLAKPIWDRSGTKKALGKDVEEKAKFYSPVYDRLETNIPHILMGFSDLAWPQGSQLFPKHETVTEYLEAYAEDVKHLVKFETQVVSVEPVGNNNGEERWFVRTKKVSPDGTGKTTEGVYDAIIVASGHFSVPYVPDIKGMKEWSEKYPRVISHSMYYRKPEDYKDQVCICPKYSRVFAWLIVVRESL